MFYGIVGWRHRVTGKAPREDLTSYDRAIWRPVIEQCALMSDQERPYRLPVLGLWQPFASLLFAGPYAARLKVHETRGWRWPDARLGQHVAVHASSRPPPPVSPELDAVCAEAFGPDWRRTLPRGAVLGTIVVDRSDDVDRMVPAGAADVYAGDWDAGRYASHVRSSSLWAAPIPFKGQQSLFWTVTEDQLNAALATVEP